MPALSFEYLPSAIDEVRACVDRLGGARRRESGYEFNWSVGESYELASARVARRATALVAALAALGPAARSGDVYARLAATS